MRLTTSTPTFKKSTFKKSGGKGGVKSTFKKSGGKGGVKSTFKKSTFKKSGAKRRTKRRKH